MPNTPQINLDVRNFASSDPWHNVQASNGQTYSYLYTGGDDGSGGILQVVEQGRDAAPLRLVADQRYLIDKCLFEDDDKHQLSWNGSGRAGTIVDENTQVETAAYVIRVKDTQANCTIDCHPPVINRSA